MANCTLPRAEWTHTAHLVTAVWLIRARGLAGAIADMPEMIRRYNDASGVANTDSAGYHETLTLGYLRCTAAILAILPVGVDLTYSVTAVFASPLANSVWPFAYWRPETLWSVAARRAWVAPDVQDLPL